MRKFLRALLLIPLGILFIVFAVANRHPVMVSFDPINRTDPALGLTMPLFVVIVAVAIIGVLAGGAGTWLTQRHWRRAARRWETEARQARAQLSDMRAAAPAPSDTRRGLPALLSGGGALVRRDKSRLPL